MSPERRAEVVELLAQHQHEYRGCSCGKKWPLTLLLVSAQDLWLAEHQVDVLAEAGIEPFKVDAVVPSTP